MANFNSNNYNNKMKQSKSPKSIAYSRLGKPLVPSQDFARKSTGNIYEDLIGGFDPKQQKYIRDLVSKNAREEAETNSSIFHNRRKSYAEIQVDPAGKQPGKEQKRQERETLCKSKNGKESLLPQQATLKLGQISQTARSDFNNRPYLKLQNQPNQITCLIQRESTKLPNRSFLDSLSNYLSQLSQTDDIVLKANIGGEKLSETLKISYENSNIHKYASKIQQQMLKIKEVKLQNHYVEKELSRRDKREKKMKNCLYQMLDEIKQINSQLSKQKRERKRLQKIIQTFEMRSQQFERKTIGKNYYLSKIDQFQTKINQFTKNQLQKSDLDASFRQVWKHSAAANKSKNPACSKQSSFEKIRHEQLDSSKIEKMFRSNYHSENQQDDIYQ